MHFPFLNKPEMAGEYTISGGNSLFGQHQRTWAESQGGQSEITLLLLKNPTGDKKTIEEIL